MHKHTAVRLAITCGGQETDSAAVHHDPPLGSAARCTRSRESLAGIYVWVAGKRHRADEVLLLRTQASVNADDDDSHAANEQPQEREHRKHRVERQLRSEGVDRRNVVRPRRQWKPTKAVLERFSR